MGELIKRQDAINAVMQNYCYESDRMTALQKLPVITDEKIRNEAIINYSVAVLAEVAERAKQEDAPIYEGDKEVDQWVRLSDVEEAINKYLNWDLIKKGMKNMGNKYTVVGNFRQPHRDCEGETLTDLSFEEVMKIESEWKKEKKYKEVFHFKQS